MQVTIDGTNLDNGSTRIITGDVSDTVSPDGERVVLVSFYMQAASASALATLYAATVAAFAKRNVACTINHGGSNLFTIAPNDGTHLQTRVGILPHHEKSGPLTVFRTLVIQAELAQVPDDAPAGLAGIESFTVTTIRPPGRGKTIVAQGTFIDTGSAAAGATALANYTTARATLLTDYLLTLSTGARGATGQVLVSEVFSNVTGDAKRLEFTLESEYRAFAMSNTASARANTIQIGITQPEEWHPDAGPRPSIITVAGSVFLDLDVLAGATLKSVWDGSLKVDVLAHVATETGQGDTRELTPPVVSFDEDQGLIQFSMALQGGNSQEIARTRRDEVIDTPIVAESVDSDGYVHEQTSPASPRRIRRVSISRVGIGEKRIAPPKLSPTIKGRAVRYRGQTAGSTRQIRSFGENVWAQAWTFEFEEIKVRTTDAPPAPTITGTGA